MSLVASFAPSLRSGAMMLLQKSCDCPILEASAYASDSARTPGRQCAEELWGQDWLTIKLNNARISMQLGNLRITRHTDRPRQNRRRGCTGILILRFSVRGWLRPLRVSPALSHFLLQTYWSPRSKTVSLCLKSCKEFLANPTECEQPKTVILLFVTRNSAHIKHWIEFL